MTHRRGYVDSVSSPSGRTVGHLWVNGRVCVKSDHVPRGFGCV